MDDYSDSENDYQKSGASAPELPVEIPAAAISAEALTGIIDNFIQRDGTDYGNQEQGHETKVLQVRRQIEKGQVRIIYESETGTVTLMPETQWKKMSALF